VNVLRLVLLLSAASLPSFTISPSTASQCCVDAELYGILVLRRALARALVRALHQVDRRLRLQYRRELESEAVAVADTGE
jgi:hypothetical protein